MFDFLLKQVLSLAISIVTIHVPKDEWQKKLDALPSQAERVAHKKLDGAWKAEIVVSPHTGLTHTYYKLPCTDSSSKKVLLLLHGLNTDGSVFFNLAPLAKKMTLIAYNFPEETDLYTGSLRDFELIIDDFCTMLNLDSINLLGNSLGGIIAVFYATHTKRVKVERLLLASTYVPGATPGNIPRLRKMTDKFLPYPDYKLFYLLTIGNRLIQGRAIGNAADREAPIESLVIKKIGWYRQTLSMLYWYDGRRDARNIGCPVLVLHGGADRLVPRAEVAATREQIPNARVFSLEKAGHTLIFAQSKECAAEIADFIN